LAPTAHTPRVWGHRLLGVNINDKHIEVISRYARGCERIRWVRIEEWATPRL
jgi:hypothetical protein